MRRKKICPASRTEQVPKRCMYCGDASWNTTPDGVSWYCTITGEPFQVEYRGNTEGLRAWWRRRSRRLRLALHCGATVGLTLLFLFALWRLVAV